MEDALALLVKVEQAKERYVLILVLMEDALARYDFHPVIYKFTYCLNPCFNGRCTRTLALLQRKNSLPCLNPCFNGRCTRTGY